MLDMDKIQKFIDESGIRTILSDIKQETISVKKDILNSDFYNDCKDDLKEFKETIDDKVVNNYKKIMHTFKDHFRN